MCARVERRSGFTLIELLVVMGIIGVLASVSIPIIAAVHTHTKVSNVKAEIARLELALSAYDHETGQYPRRPGPLPSGNDLFRNDAPYLYAALRNAPTPGLGGGPTTLLGDWDRRRIAAVKNEVLAWDFGTRNSGDELPAAPWVEPIPDHERDLVESSSYQAAHLPGSGRALVLLDVWGNPYVYLDWSNVPRSVRENAVCRGTSVLKNGQAPEWHELRARHPIVIISFGPNGVYELGGGDDVSNIR